MRNYLAHSILGIYLSRLLQKAIYTNCRAHWIRDALAGDIDFARLARDQKVKWN